MTFCSNYGSISCCFWDIQCQKISWPWNPGQKSLEVIDSGTIQKNGYGFLLVCYSNIVPKMYCFWDIQLVSIRRFNLETPVRSHSRSSEPTRIDRLPTTSYLCSVATMGPSRAVSEINDDFSRKSQIFPTPCILHPWWMGSPWNWVPALGVKKLDWLGYRAE